MPGLVAGIECSTRLTHVLVADPADGRVVAESRANHAVLGVGERRDGDADSWWNALGEAIGETKWAGDIAAVSVVAPHRGLVAVDGPGRGGGRARRARSRRHPRPSPSGAGWRAPNRNCWPASVPSGCRTISSWNG